MSSLSLDANCIDALKAVAFAAVFLFNRHQQAAIVLIAHCLCEFLMSSPLNGFMTALLMAVLFSELSALKITIKSEIRYIFIALSCVNWFCAADIWMYPKVDTVISVSYPYMINLLDLLVIYHLLRPTHGGGKRANHYNSRFILGAWLNRRLLH